MRTAWAAIRILWTAFAGGVAAGSAAYVSCLVLPGWTGILLGLALILSILAATFNLTHEFVQQNPQ